MCRALEYGNAVKSTDIVKHLCSKENYAQKCQLIGLIPETKPVNWPKDSQIYNIYINEEGVYELVFSSQQPEAKNFRRHCCNLMFPQIQQQLANQMKEVHQQAIIDRDNQIEPLSLRMKKNASLINKPSKKKTH